MTSSGETPRFSFDALGRITAVEYPNGKKIRHFAYAGESDEIARVTVEDRERATTRVFVKQFEKSWHVYNESGKKLGEWRGTVRLSSDGTYSLLPAGGRDCGYWRTYRGDGLELREFVGEKGGRAVFDAQGRLLSACRADGAQLHVEYCDSVAVRVMEVAPDKPPQVWVRKGKSWICAAQPDQPVRRSLTFGKRGEFHYMDGAGQKHTVRLDGSHQINDCLADS